MFVLSAVTALAAPEPGALRGKSFGNSVTTDGNDSTQWNATSWNSSYTFPNAVEVTGYYFYASGDVRLRLYDSNGILIATLSPRATPTNVYQNVSYKDVKRVNLYGASDGYSKRVFEVDLRVIEVDVTPPEIPKNIVLEPGVNKIFADWDDVPDADLAGYNIYVNGVKRNKDLILESSFDITNLQALTNYGVQVSAVDNDGNESLKSTLVSALVMDEAKPPILKATYIKDTSLTLTWDKVADNFEIYRDDVLIRKQSTTLLNIDKLSPNTSYDFKVIAIDRFGRRNESNVLSVTTIFPILAKPVLSLKNITHNSALITWQTVTGATSYDLFINNDLVMQSAATSYNAIDLESNTIYNIKLVAKSDDQQSDVLTSFTTKSMPVPTINNAKVAIDKDDKSKRNVSYQASNDVTAVDVYVNGELVGTYPVGQDIKLDFADLISKLADIEIKPTDPNGVGFKTTVPVDSTGDEAIDEITGEMTNSYTLVHKAFLYIALGSLVLVILVVLFFWLRKRLKPMLLSADDNKPFASADQHNPKSNYAKGKSFAVDRTKNERFVYQPRQRRVPKYKQQGFEIASREEKIIPVGFMGTGGYRKKVDITYRKNDVLYKQQYVRGQGKIYKPIDTTNQIKHVRNQYQSVKRFVTGNYKKN